MSSGSVTFAQVAARTSDIEISLFPLRTVRTLLADQVDRRTWRRLPDRREIANCLAGTQRSLRGAICSCPTFTRSCGGATVRTVKQSF